MRETDERNIDRLPPIDTPARSRTCNLVCALTGMEPEACWCMGQCVNQLSPLARAGHIHF